MKLRAVLWLAVPLVVSAAGAFAWAGFAPPGEQAREVTHVIAKGTWARRMAGEKLDVLPAEIHLTLDVKDVLVMQNDDDVPQMFGPVLIMPGQNFRLPFRVASRYDFACTAHVNGQLTVFVAPPPQWWQRVQLRAAALARSVGWT